MRHLRRLRASLVLGLLAALGHATVAPPVEALCPTPAAAMPERCCGDEAPPRCPSCPSESRSSCPAPSRGRTLVSPEALPPGDSAPVSPDARAGATTTAAAETAPAAPARSSAAARRAAVTGASPPVRLLACTFRN
ncbi:MAG: hypothetical protein U0529_13965 [Thermoanaerobaculia bacterium]